MNTKALLSLLCLSICLLSLKANHITTGYITYKHIGGANTGLPNGTYEVELAEIRLVNVANYGTTPPRYYEVVNGCGSNISSTLKHVKPSASEKDPQNPNAFRLDLNFGCSTPTKNWELYIYRDTISINFTCADIKFYPELVCCRDVKDNHVFATVTGVFVYASLNNVNGHVSLPRPDMANLINTACINQEVHLPNFTAHSSAEFWQFNKVQPKNRFYRTDPITNWDYLAGYDQNTPLPVDTTTGYNLDTSSGELYFKPNLIGYYAYAKLYRQYDSIGNNRYLVGALHYEGAIWVGSGCDTTVTAGPQVSFNNGDTIYSDTCGITNLDLELNLPALRSSIDTGGSDFVIISTQGDTVGIKEVKIVRSQKIRLVFNDSLKNGNYRVSLRQGIDSNTIKNLCGFETIQKHQLTFNVQGCSNVSLMDFAANKVSIYPVPADDQLFIQNNMSIPIKSISVYNTVGQKLMENTSSQKYLSISQLKPGSYLLRIKFALGDITTHWFVKK